MENISASKNLIPTLANAKEVGADCSRTKKCCDLEREHSLSRLRHITAVYNFRGATVIAL
jgi:hypothetical protein